MSERVRKEIGGMEDEIVKLTGAHTTTFAYPFGSVPKKEKWAEKEDGRYAFTGMFLVLAAVAVAVRRRLRPVEDRPGPVRGQDKENDCKKYCSTAWLEYLDKHPEERYTSDGDPNTVTFPKAAEDRLAKEYRARARTY